MSPEKFKTEEEAMESAKRRGFKGEIKLRWFGSLTCQLTSNGIMSGKLFYAEIYQIFDDGPHEPGAWRQYAIA